MLIVETGIWHSNFVLFVCFVFLGGLFVFCFVLFFVCLFVYFLVLSPQSVVGKRSSKIQFLHIV